VNYRGMIEAIIGINQYTNFTKSVEYLSMALKLSVSRNGLLSPVINTVRPHHPYFFYRLKFCWHA
jgi:hypothetical protein